MTGVLARVAALAALALLVNFPVPGVFVALLSALLATVLAVARCTRAGTGAAVGAGTRCRAVYPSREAGNDASRLSATDATASTAAQCDTSGPAERDVSCLNRRVGPRAGALARLRAGRAPRRVDQGATGVRTPPPHGCNAGVQRPCNARVQHRRCTRPDQGTSPQTPVRAQRARRTTTRPNAAKRRHLRRQLAARDGSRCFYCGHPFAALADATLDHLIPYSIWPTWRQANLVLACGPCNHAKANRLPQAWLRPSGLAPGLVPVPSRAARVGRAVGRTARRLSAALSAAAFATS